jgi:repressor LexA
MARPLTQRQREVLSFIVGRLRQSGTAPTLREICQRLGINSTNGAADHLVGLERKGCLVYRKDGKARDIAVLDAGYLELGYARCGHCGQMAEPGKKVA